LGRRAGDWRVLGRRRARRAQVQPRLGGHRRRADRAAPAAVRSGAVRARGRGSDGPSSTFAGLADILGFIFLLIGVQWMAQAFTERAFNPYWWLTLIGAILMVVLAFWASGQFFVERAYTLLIFVGIWALPKGVTDIVRAFQIRSLR
jgi:hypothetical protein